MKIALIGTSGNVGSRIAAELSSRGHQITAIARNPGKIAALPGIRPTAVDVADTESLAAILKGHAAVISSVHFTASDPDQLIRAVEASGVPRYLVIEVPAAFRWRQASSSSILPTSRRNTKARHGRAVSSSTDCAPKKISTGPSCRHRMCSSPASARDSSASVRMTCC